MSALTGALSRLFAAEGPLQRLGTASRSKRPVSPPGRPTSEPEGVLTERIGDTIVLRTMADDSLTQADLGDLTRALRPTEGTATVMSIADTTEPQFWRSLSEALNSLRDTGVKNLRLVLSGAASATGDRPAVARRISDTWDMQVLAPEAEVLFVPGGTLFVPSADAEGGWWSFSPGQDPRPAGPRLPAPAWQSEVDGRLPAGAPDGCVVELIPAGVAVRPREAEPSRPRDIHHAVPVDGNHPALVVDGQDVTAEQVAALLAGLGETVRPTMRLVPGAGQDLLPLAQRVCDLLGAELEVFTGVPVLTGTGSLDVRTVRMGPDGAPRWQPFVDSVVCRPSPADGSAPAPAPRLGRWNSPLPREPAAPGVLPLSEAWQVTLTRAGLRVSGSGDASGHAGLPVAVEGAVLEIGVPGERLDHTLWPALADLLRSLPRETRTHAVLHVHGVCLDGGSELRRLAARFNCSTIRYDAEATSRRRPPRPRAPRPLAGEVVVPPPAPAEHEPSAVQSASPPPAATPPDTRPAPTQPLPDTSAYGTPSSVQEPRGPHAAADATHGSSYARRSTEADQAAFRSLLGTAWKQHDPTVLRVLGQMPALHGREREAARGDLVAVRVYLTAREGPLSRAALVQALRTGDERLAPYAACLASGLRRLPSYEGVAVRGKTSDGIAGLRQEIRPGLVLRESAPVSAIPLVSAGAPPRVRYAVWSVSAAAVRQLLGSDPLSDTVVFAPGTQFRVLAIRGTGPDPLVLLRELPAGTAVSGAQSELDDMDRTALLRLTHALRPGPQMVRQAGGGAAVPVTADG
ncbi:hypothetical protein [Streptomyces sp. NPDC093970]|uniref:hypothetical protein n=1 Tax=Streptomyces sp. NPDC093970 TaxID=3155076 RepID=UPI0034162D1F